jgi:hypothetical protein
MRAGRTLPHPRDTKREEIARIPVGDGPKHLEAARIRRRVASGEGRSPSRAGISIWSTGA